MNPRALAAWSAAGLTMALATSNPVYRLLVLLAAVNVVVALRRGDARLRPLFIAIAVATLVAVALTVVLSHTGSHVFAAIPGGVPVIGGSLTVEAVVFGLSTGAGIASAVLAAAPLSLVIEPHELVDALPRALSRSGAAVATALNLLPGLARSATEIRDAQRMRGWRPRRLRDWPEVAVPVVLTAVENSLALAEAMEARGYGLNSRTARRAQRWRMADVGVAVCAMAAAAAFVALRVTGAAADWYPFPALSVPSVDARAVICCVSLVLPALLWRPS